VVVECSLRDSSAGAEAARLGGGSVGGAGGAECRRRKVSGVRSYWAWPTCPRIKSSKRH
jgi:hypothetical protein